MHYTFRWTKFVLVAVRGRTHTWNMNYNIIYEYDEIFFHSTASRYECVIRDFSLLNERKNVIRIAHRGRICHNEWIHSFKQRKKEKKKYFTLVEIEIPLVRELFYYRIRYGKWKKHFYNSSQFTFSFMRWIMCCDEFEIGKRFAFAHTKNVVLCSLLHAMREIYAVHFRFIKILNWCFSMQSSSPAKYTFFTSTSCMNVQNDFRVALNLK